MASTTHSAHPTPWDRTWKLMSAERQDLAVVTIYSVVVGLLSLALPVAVQSLVNTVAFGTVLQPLVVLSILVFAALAFAALLQCLRLWVVEKIQRRVFARLADQVGDLLGREALALSLADEAYSLERLAGPDGDQATRPRPGASYG